MDNIVYTVLPNLVSNTDSKPIITTTTTTTAPVTITTTASKSDSFTSLPSIDIVSTPSLETLQSIPATPSIDVYSDQNNGSNRIITQPIYSRLLSDLIKREHSEDQPQNEKYSIPETDRIHKSSGITSIQRSPRETINGQSGITMTNTSGPLISNLNTSHIPNGNGSYFSSGLSNDLTVHYKLSTTSNTDLPSPSTSSNSSNPSSFHQGKRHGEGADPNRKREVRLQKNRDAARECRRKKKEYIKCLEERVTGLEKQNKALIEELRQLKELYCQRDDAKSITTTR